MLMCQSVEVRKESKDRGGPDGAGANNGARKCAR